jgi:hypothetical protein
MKTRVLTRVFRLDEIKVQADGAVRIVSGHAAVFNSLSEDIWPGVKERIMPDAFRDVLDNDVRLLLNHDPNFVLARTKSGTLTLSQDAVGLRIRAELPDTQAARDLAVLMERGDIDGMSFAFEVDPDDVKREERDGYELDTVYRVSRLYDVSVVTYPAYPAASAKIRAFDTSAPEDGSVNGERGEATAEASTRRAVGIATEKAHLASQELIGS